MDVSTTPSPIALAQAVAQCTASIVITDLTGAIEYVNPWFTKVTGYTPEEVLGKNPRVLKSGYTTSQDYVEMWRTVSLGREWRGRFHNRRKDGSLFWEEALIAPVIGTDGKVTHYLAVKEDVTAQVLAERARDGTMDLLHRCNLARSQQELLQGAVDFFWSFSKAAAVRIFPAEATLPHKTTASAGRLEDGAGQEIIIPLKRGEEHLGSLCLLLRMGQTVTNEEKNLWAEISEAVAIAWARWNSEEALRYREQQHRQAQKMEAVGQLAGGVAHDYNNILTATLLHLSLLQGMPGLPMRAHQILSELELEAKRASNLTRQLLLFSRRHQAKVEFVDLRAILSNLYVMLVRVLGENVRLEFPNTGVAHWIKADAGMMEQVIVNLCVNARDAMQPKGGRLNFQVSKRTLGESEFRAQPLSRPGNFVCLVVRDEGCGMSEETKARIFEPFFTTKGLDKGTGLGLATVYGIVTQHGGWVEVDSEVGTGTEFRIFLPEAIRPEVPVTVQSLQKDRTGNGEMLLFVEDERMVRATGASALRLQGYEVIDVANGPEALKAWESHKEQISLVVTDLVMPGGLSGPDVIRHCKAEDPGMPCILTSGYSPETETMDNALMEGVVYLPKPYDLHQLAAAVGNILQNRNTP